MKPRFIKLFLALFLPFASFLLLAHFLFYYNNKYENNLEYVMRLTFEKQAHAAYNGEKGGNARRRGRNLHEC